MKRSGGRDRPDLAPFARPCRPEGARRFRKLIFTRRSTVSEQIAGWTTRKEWASTHLSAHVQKCAPIKRMTECQRVVL
jgi:hypothetical protein